MKEGHTNMTLQSLIQVSSGCIVGYTDTEVKKLSALPYPALACLLSPARRLITSEWQTKIDPGYPLGSVG
jgi:hypothetical protein